MTISFDASEMTRLAVDLGRAGAKAVPTVAVAVQAGGKLLEAGWRANAAATSGVHGKHYPKSIKAKPTGVLESTVAPDPGMMQGGMSFEFGSRNQPPHLDGARALAAFEPQFLSMVEKAATEGVL